MNLSIGYDISIMVTFTRRSFDTCRKFGVGDTHVAKALVRAITPPFINATIVALIRDIRLN